MTDISTSLLGTESALGSGLNLDASTIDSNLRSIRTVESTWRLPALTDDIRLDLAGNPAIGPDNLSGFLYGLERDVFQENDEDLAPEPVIPQFRVQSTQPFTDLQQTTFEKANSLITSLRGKPQSDVIDGSATQRWKMRAIEKGFLTAPEDGVIDGTWSPEMESIRREMAWSEYDDRMRGNKFGAMPIEGDNGLLKMLNDWTSPSGLLRAAIDLDFFWDVGNIQSEFSSWGDKWRKVGDSDGILDFGKNLFDALTGPIDDIAVPVLNMALLFSGVGAGVNFARLGATGLRAAEGVEAFRFASSLYKVPGAGLVGRIFPMLDNVADAQRAYSGLGQASMLAGRLQKGGRVASSVGDALAGWRSLDPVIKSRRFVQTGMRLGFVSQVQNNLLPGYQGGVSLGDNEAIARVADRAVSNPMVNIVGELLFTPFSTFEPGTFVNGGREAVQGAFKFLGSAPGRAVVGGVAGAGIGAAEGDTEDVLLGAAVGAGGLAAAPAVAGSVADAVRDVPVLSKMVGHPANAVSKLSWAPIANDQRATMVFAQALERKLGPDRWREFSDTMGRDGFVKAFANHIGTDENGAGAAMSYVLLSAAIDHTAAQQAGKIGSAGWHERYFLARNKLTAQIRSFGDDVTKEELVWATVTKEAKSRRGLRKRFERALNGTTTEGADFDTVQTVTEAWDDARLAEALATHNSQAQLTIRQLLSPDNLPIQGLDERSMANLGGVIGQNPDDRFAAMVDYVANTLDTFGDWGKYTSVTSAMRSQIAAGMFDDARLLAPKSITGRMLKQLDYIDDFSPTFDESKIDWAVDIHDTMFLPKGMNIEQWRQSGGYYNPFAREIDPNKSRFTLAKADTLTKANFIEAADELKASLDMLNSWRTASKLRSAGGVAALTEGKIGTLGIAEMAQYVKALGVTNPNEAAALRRLNRLAKQSGLTVDQAFETTVRRHLDDLAADPRWTDTFGLSEIVRSKDNKALSGVDLLAARRKELLKKAKFTAAEVDAKALLADMEAAGRTADADQLRAFMDHAESQGYKVVFGQDFLQPDELLHTTGLFADVNAKHMNAMTLGNFFGRKHPEALAKKVQNYRAIAIASELSAATGDSFLPDSPRVQQALRDLYDFVLDPELSMNARIADEFHNQSWLTRRSEGVKNAFAPKSLQDLGLGVNQRKVVSKLQGAGYSADEALAIWRGLKKGRFADWSDQGLYAIEAKLRQNNQITDALRLFSATDEAGKFSAKKAVISAATTATLGAGIAAANEGDVTDGALAGLGVSGVGAATGVLGAGRAINALDYSKWSRYGYLADNLASWRDTMRFALSPFFDLSRYTEAFTLNQIAGPARGPDGKRIAIPFNASPKKLRKMIGDGEFKRVTSEMRQASKGVYDMEALETADKWFQEIGILGFNPTQWMTSSFYHMRQNGLDPAEAWEKVNEMYHYGTRGRSAAEMSANFIFFPFSFSKKTLTHAAQFLADDMMRSVLLHDAYATYQFLDERYDLEQLAEDHLPVLERMKQLNMFAFGASLGRLGGINAPYVDFMVGNPLERDEGKKGLIFNLFNPQAVFIPAEEGKRSEFESLVRRSIPILNDIQWMIEDGKSQVNVITSPTHQTKAAEARDGYAEWSEFKKGIDAALQQNGATFYDLHNNPGLAGLKAMYEEKRTELAEKYPGWVESKLRSQERRAEMEQERQYRINTAMYRPDEATEDDRMFLDMEQYIERVRAKFAQRGITEIEDLPPQAFEMVQSRARDLAGRKASFDRIWNKFYRTDWGIYLSPASSL
jgi:hypothetical protein